MRKFFGFVVCSFMFLGCSNNGIKPKTGTEDSTATSRIAKIEIYDQALAGIIDSNSKIEIIGRGYEWAEGPVWIAAKKELLFSDVPANKVYSWKEGDSARVYLQPSGYTDTAKRLGENGANGLALDKQGRLLLCQSGNRQIARMDAPIDSPRAVFTVLSAKFQGKRFNSPNDLIADSHNNIYFTDPIYGLPQRATDPTRELKFEGVYKISSDGNTTLLLDSIVNPNGLALSADERTLYIATSNDAHPGWYSYQLNEKGNVSSGGILLDGTEMQRKAAIKQGADGFKIDKVGNIFSAGPDGINIISPNGKLLGLIRIYDRRSSNCAFNETGDILYITAKDLLLRLKLH